MAQIPDKTTIAETFQNAIPYAREVGMTIELLEDGLAEMRMPYDARLVGDPETGVMHGGAVLALMDSCCGLAVIAHPDVPGLTATLGLRTDHLRKAVPGQAIVVRAECYLVTRSVAFVRATAWDDDRTRPVALSTGTFTVGGQA
ncbi:PaaI family thioesterase [Mesobacterium pallidum]|uniref:PaaI family thioesterase n=1 Tax=Mesobacterium pallidum TaxID=2872037 RepID=UPI0023430364|nr:PaaI family thioesterase [Mesobacterium pallidum]